MNNYSSPVAIIGNHSFSQISCGNYHSAGLKSDGSLWTWGRNDLGQLETGNIVSYSSPVAVIGSHSFSQVDGGRFFSLGLKIE